MPHPPSPFTIRLTNAGLCSIGTRESFSPNSNSSEHQLNSITEEIHPLFWDKCPAFFCIGLITLKHHMNIGLF